MHISQVLLHKHSILLTICCVVIKYHEVAPSPSKLHFQKKSALKCFMYSFAFSPLTSFNFVYWYSMSIWRWTGKGICHVVLALYKWEQIDLHIGHTPIFRQLWNKKWLLHKYGVYCITLMALYMEFKSIALRGFIDEYNKYMQPGQLTFQSHKRHLYIEH